MSRLTVLQLVVSLDWANCVCGTIYTATNDAVPTSHACPRCDRSVQLALIAAVHAFSLRWLPLVTNQGVDCQELMSLGDRLWQNARSRVMSIFDKLSYQSVLALYLFGLTPTYQGALVDQNTVRVAGEVSVDMALRQIHRLRVKRQDLSFSGTGLSPSAEQAQRQADGDRQSLTEDFVHAENMMYWAAVVFDISASMTRGSPSILISGVFGFEDEPVIRLMKARVQLFHESTEAWRQNGFVPTNHTALAVVHRASTWKGYLWKVIGALREAINNGHEQSVISRLQTLVREGLERFDRTFRPLLAVCERHILFLSKDARLCYCKYRVLLDMMVTESLPGMLIFRGSSPIALPYGTVASMHPGLIHRAAGYRPGLRVRPPRSRSHHFQHSQLWSRLQCRFRQGRNARLIDQHRSLPAPCPCLVTACL